MENKAMELNKYIATICYYGSLQKGPDGEEVDFCSADGVSLSGCKIDGSYIIATNGFDYVIVVRREDMIERWIGETLVYVMRPGSYVRVSTDESDYIVEVDAECNMFDPKAELALAGITLIANKSISGTIQYAKGVDDKRVDGLFNREV